MNGEGEFQLNVATGANSPVGNYAITIAGTGGGVTQTALVGLELQVPYFVNPAGNTLGVQLGTQETMEVTISVDAGFNAPVALAATGQPNGVSISFAPDSITAVESSTMTVTVASTVAVGSYPITITGTANGLNEQAPFSLNVTSGPPPTFTLSASPASLTVPASSQASTTLTVTPQNGFSGQVSLTCSCSAIPSRDSYSLAPFLPTSGTAVTTPFTIYTSSPSSTGIRVSSHPLLTGTSLALALCFLGWKRRRSLGTALLCLFALSGLAMISSCGGGGAGGGSGGGGGGGGGGGSSPTIFNVTVTATSGSIQKATTISVTLN